MEYNYQTLNPDSYDLISIEQAKIALDDIEKKYNNLLSEFNIQDFNSINNSFSSLNEVQFFKADCKNNPILNNVPENCKEVICFLAFEIRTLQTYLYEREHEGEQEFTITYTENNLYNTTSLVEKNLLNCSK